MCVCVCVLCGVSVDVDCVVSVVCVRLARLVSRSAHSHFRRSDVELSVHKRAFKLHRAIVCPRCKWLAVLVSDNWKGSMSGKAQPVIEINAFTPDVFAVVVEFLYTGCARAD